MQRFRVAYDVVRDDKTTHIECGLQADSRKDALKQVAGPYTKNAKVHGPQPRQRQQKGLVKV